MSAASSSSRPWSSASGSPALKVDVLGANHMSFIEDPDTCGLPCSFCNAPVVTNDVVTGIARSYLVAFFGRHLRGQQGYDLFLTGEAAVSRYVDTGLATIASK